MDHGRTKSRSGNRPRDLEGLNKIKISVVQSVSQLGDVSKKLNQLDGAHLELK